VKGLSAGARGISHLKTKQAKAPIKEFSLERRFDRGTEVQANNAEVLKKRVKKGKKIRLCN